MSGRQRGNIMNKLAALMEVGLVAWPKDTLSRLLSLLLYTHFGMPSPVPFEACVSKVGVMSFYHSERNSNVLAKPILGALLPYMWPCLKIFCALSVWSLPRDVYHSWLTVC